MNSTPHADDHWARYYQSGRDFRLISASALTKILTFYNRAAPRTCLDIGCGTGQLTRELAHRNFDCTGIDVAQAAIDIAKSLTVSSKLQYHKLDVEKADLTTLPLQPYGMITCKYVYAFIQNKIAFLKRINKILDQHGTLVIITPLAKDVPSEKAHIAVDYDTTLKELQFIFPTVIAYEVPEATTFICKK